jgi:hypothetical protein
MRALYTATGDSSYLEKFYQELLCIIECNGTCYNARRAAHERMKPDLGILNVCQDIPTYVAMVDHKQRVITVWS